MWELSYCLNLVYVATMVVPRPSFLRIIHFARALSWKMAEADCSMTILIMTVVGAHAIKHYDYLTTPAVWCHPTSAIGNIPDTIEATSRELTPCIPAPPETQLYLKFDVKPKIPGEALYKTNACGISSQHFFTDFNWDSGFAEDEQHIKV